MLPNNVYGMNNYLHWKVVKLMEQTDRRTDGEMEGQMDGQMDAQRKEGNEEQRYRVGKERREKEKMNE